MDEVNQLFNKFTDFSTDSKEIENLLVCIEADSFKNAETNFIWTIFYGHGSRKMTLPIARTLIKKGLDVNAVFEHKTVLHYACASPNIGKEIITLIVSKTTNINKSDDEGRTPLYYACAIETIKEDVVRILIENGACVNVIDSYGNTIIHQVCHNKSSSKDLVNFLLQSGAVVNSKNSSDSLPLHIAVKQCKSPDILQSIIENTDVNKVDDSGRTPLHWFCIRSFPQTKTSDIDLQVIKSFIDQKADTILFDKYHCTPLYYACDNNNLSQGVLELLINRFNMNAANASGRTPLHAVCANKNASKEIVQFMIRNGASVNAISNSLSTPLHILCSNHSKKIEIIKYLISEDADVDRLDYENFKPLDIMNAKIKDDEETYPPDTFKNFHVKSRNIKPLLLIYKYEKTNLNLFPKEILLEIVNLMCIATPKTKKNKIAQ